MLGRERVELGVLAGLDSLVRLCIAVKLAGSQHKFARLTALVGRLNPPSSKLKNETQLYPLQNI